MVFNIFTIKTPQAAAPLGLLILKTMTNVLLTITCTFVCLKP